MGVRYHLTTSPGCCCGVAPSVRLSARLLRGCAALLLECLGRCRATSWARCVLLYSGQVVSPTVAVPPWRCGRHHVMEKRVARRDSQSHVASHDAGCRGCGTGVDIGCGLPMQSAPSVRILDVSRLEWGSQTRHAHSHAMYLAACAVHCHVCVARLDGKTVHLSARLGSACYA